MKISSSGGLIDCFLKDSQRYTGRNFIRSYLIDPRYRACVVLRLMQASHRSRFVPKIISIFLKNRLLLKYGIDTRPDVTIGPGIRFVHLGGIVIHGGAIIGENFTCLNNVTVGQRRRSDLGVPVIGNNVFVGAYSLLLGDITISSGTSIDAMQLIDNDV